MFFFLAVISMLAYTFQNTLLVHHARKIDGLSLAVYRNLSLGISMIPLLFLASKSDFLQIPHFSSLIFWAGLTGAISLSLSFVSLRFLPVGIANTFGSSATIIIIFLLGRIFFQETITPIQITLVGIILIGSILLGFQKNGMAHLDSRTSLGIFFRVTASFFTGMTFFLMSKISRELSPFIAGYIWELSIGIFALILAFGRQIFWKQKLTPISKKTFGTILLISSPTLIGSGCFAYSITIGPVGIASVISVAGGIFMSMILAHFWYREKLSLKQWLTISIIVVGLAGLKFVGI